MKADHPPLTAEQRRNHRVELLAWLVYALLFASCQGQFASRPFLTATLLLASLAALAFGRPIIRTAAVAAFLFPVLGILIFHYGSHLRRRNPATTTLSLQEIDQAIDAKSTKPADQSEDEHRP